MNNLTIRIDDNNNQFGLFDKFNLVLGRFNVIVGDNDIGKSNLLYAIAQNTNCCVLEPGVQDATNYLRQHPLAEEPLRSVIKHEVFDAIPQLSKALDGLYRRSPRNNSAACFLALYYLTQVAGVTDTPEFFAIDNCCSTLGTRLAYAVTAMMIDLAEQNNKRVVLVTHSRDVVEALDLDDDSQHLYKLVRGTNGLVRAERCLHINQAMR